MISPKTNQYETRLAFNQRKTPQIQRRNDAHSGKMQQ